MKLWHKLEYVNVGDHLDIDEHSIGLMPLLKNVISKNEGYLTEFNAEKTIKVDLDIDSEKDSKEYLFRSFQYLVDKYYDFFIVKGARLIHQELYIKEYNAQGYIFIWNDGIASLNVTGNNVNIRIISQQEKLIEEVKCFFEAQETESPKRKGHVYVITSSGGGLDLHSLGNAGISLIPENYTLQVMEDYNFVINDLQSKSPSGRVTIMHGSPGTGKTHMIRGMLLEVPDAMFVLVSPDMVSSLVGPELISLLLSYRDNNTGPIILILEDADKCLVTRASDNMNSIQSLLNLGEGILGSMLDLRIVATTNAKGLEIEKALLRRGRLSKKLEIGTLDLVTAQKIFMRLCPNVEFPPEISINYRENTTLADVYGLARDCGWVPTVREQIDTNSLVQPRSHLRNDCD